MAKTVEVPLPLLRKVAKTADMVAQLEDELEDYLLSKDPSSLLVYERPGRLIWKARSAPSLTSSETCVPGRDHLWVNHQEKTLTFYGVAHRRSIYRQLK